MDTGQKACVVVLEAGAPWPAGVFGSSVNRHEVVVVHEEPGETDRQLLARVLLLCSAQAKSGVRFQTGVLSCSGTSDDGRLESRTRLACGLLMQLLRTPDSRLVLVTDDRRGPATNSLLGLAGVLVEFLTGTSVSIDVRAEPQPVVPIPFTLLGAGSVRSTRPPAKRVSARTQSRWAPGGPRPAVVGH
jgi:hypothetical protein